MTPFRAGFLILLITAAAVPAFAQVTALTGATVIGAGQAPIPDAVVIIEGSRIARVGPAAGTPVPPGATVVDVRGKFVMPGLIDMHNHVQVGGFRRGQNPRIPLSLLLAYGVTTVFNPSISTKELAELRTLTAGDAAPFPRVFSAGPIVSVKGDIGRLAVDGSAPESPADARAAVKALKAAGVDAIKVSRDDVSWAMRFTVPVMPAPVLAALVDEAHREGLKVFVHAPLLDHAKAALRAGADGLLHGIVDRAVDQELIDLLTKNRAFYVPTLAMFEAVGDMSAWGRRQSRDDGRQLVAGLADAFASGAEGKRFAAMFDNTAFVKDRMAILRANVKRVADAGIPVVMGTDTGFYGVISGVSSQIEVALMAEAGLTADAALRAATINAARMLGRDTDLGSIEAGKLADLLVLDANPLDNVGNLRQIYRVVRGGAVLDPAQLVSGIRFGPLPPPALPVPAVK